MMKKPGFYFIAISVISFFRVAHASELLSAVSAHSLMSGGRESGELVTSSEEDEIYVPRNVSEGEGTIGTGEPVSLVGQAKIEPRYTRVISDQCGRLPCHQSQVYWALVIESSSGIKYLWNHKLSVGVSQAPDVIEIAGVKIYSGTTVQVEAKMMKLAPDLIILIEVEKVQPFKTLG